MATFMAAVESMIVATAMPTIIGDLGASACSAGCSRRIS
jgi:hypothetical protein